MWLLGRLSPDFKTIADFRRDSGDACLIHHSDRGSQYVSIRYTERLAEVGIEPSLGSKGDSYDNALAETINGLYKAELIHRRPPRKTVESLELAPLEWVAWFNHQRLVEPISYIPPAEAEDRYHLQLPRRLNTPAFEPRSHYETRGDSQYC
jgi:putative transposase